MPEMENNAACSKASAGLRPVQQIMTSRERRAPSKFYLEDVVRSIWPPHELGVIMRCWHDSEDFPPVSGSADPLSRPLEPGEIGVSFIPCHRREILRESDFELMDRTFQPGDACKKDLRSVEAAMVTSIEVEAKLQHAITGVPLPVWLPSSALEAANDIYIGDFVAYDDWVGQIEEIFDEAIVQMTAGSLVRVPQLGARLQVGDSGSDILPPPAENAGSLFAQLVRSSPTPTEKDTVLNVRPTVIAVNWLAINQKLEPALAATRQRPAQFWSGADLSKLNLIRGHHDNKARVGDKYLLRDPWLPEKYGIQPSLHGNETADGGTISVMVFVAKETRTRVKLLWQDGHVEECDAKDLTPYLNVDEYDCWPGDYVIHKTEDSKRVAIVQSVNSTDRTAVIRYHGTTITDLVSVLELDPHGASLNDGLAESYDGFGVRRSDFVFIHAEGTTNGAVLPRVPKIGEVEDWVREVPHMVENADGTATLGGWRGELHMMGQNIAKIRGTPEAAGRELDGRVNKVAANNGVDWFGEVLGMRTDGFIEVMLGNSEVKTFLLERLTRLNDPMDIPMDIWAEEYSDGYGHDEHEGHDDALHAQHNSAGGTESKWMPFNAEAELMDEWEDVEEWSSVAADVSMTVDESVPSNEMDVDRPDEMTVESILTAPSSPPEPPQNQTTQHHLTVPKFITLSSDSSAGPSSVSATPPVIDVAAKKAKDLSNDDEDDSWQRFAILPQAPVDHAFHSSKPSHPTKAFMSRLNKEYRVLRSSLPESILVRAYEDRVDLMRCLIIGPGNTPYQDAPFVIDWHLDSEFPQTPPQAHFFSWTNGNGRVNPNLYEEGKVCLSILGTWAAGDRSESWSAARSSLLQAFVSIQGLVLVREPWFCEPAYEKLRNTDEGMVNSRLYNEKAYVLSRGFVRRALEIPLGGLEAEICRFYLEQGRLKHIIEEARELIEQSKQPEASSASVSFIDQAVPRLTAGGALLLSRTLTKLDALWEARTTGR